MSMWRSSQAELIARTIPFYTATANAQRVFSITPRKARLGQAELIAHFKA